jgi:hypothetical protein
MSRVHCNIRVSPVVESASKVGCVAAVLVDMRGEECVGTAGWGRDSAPNSPNSALKSRVSFLHMQGSNGRCSAAIMALIGLAMRDVNARQQDWRSSISSADSLSVSMTCDDNAFFSWLASCPTCHWLSSPLSLCAPSAENLQHFSLPPAYLVRTTTTKKQSNSSHSLMIY